MWCVGVLTEQYRQRMYELLDLYARPLKRDEPVVCIDEKSTQLLCHSRPPLRARPGTPLREDYEYVRAGTANIFVAVEPRAGRRTLTVTEHRGKRDFVAFVRYLLRRVYRKARRVHLVLDNLDTHFRRCFESVLGVRAARRLLRRVVFHHTPKHASWLNIAEIEISALTRQCLRRRVADHDTLRSEVKAWQQRRNRQRRTVEWTFTRHDAARKLSRHYVSKLTVR